jgi:hypothetical protein
VDASGRIGKSGLAKCRPCDWIGRVARKVHPPKENRLDNPRIFASLFEVA